MIDNWTVDEIKYLTKSKCFERVRDEPFHIAIDWLNMCVIMYRRELNIDKVLGGI